MFTSIQIGENMAESRVDRHGRDALLRRIRGKLRQLRSRLRYSEYARDSETKPLTPRTRRDKRRSTFLRKKATTSAIPRDGRI